ncbi:hypothetical protein [Cognatishimia sp. F0-27]|uniref:hypothetical protein n=1 Tax=Cognatishimia sp. F0-27 TaxID=2816855 RepID=UPI001D0C02D0|nr:hypothetical protein [Cognatishimia sp. F0-27]MCC1494194.1 hypothetical protein [Cognatishimia sp. F0-27]
MTLRAWALGLLAALTLSGCAAVTTHGGDASIEEVRAAVYRHDGPPKLTLYTMINNRSGAGAHTSLMINASQRVIFDPAGSVRYDTVPEIGDVLYGVTPRVADSYARAHARETYHVVIQEVEVSREVAERALQLAIRNGTVPSAQCAASTSALLRQLPGFQTISSTWFPKNLMEQFGALPGVKTRRLFENDADDKTLAIEAFDAAAAQGG